MKNIFTLFSDHLELARYWWQALVCGGDTVLDATCGQGYDTLALANLAVKDGRGAVFALDIQAQALAATRQRLEQSLSPQVLERVILRQQDHACLPEEIKPASLALAVYNLGYLPGSDKQVITMAESTVNSLAAVLPCIQAGGAISVMCYLGHPGGQAEYEAVAAWAAQLPRQWSVCSHHWTNAQQAPVWVFIQRARDSKRGS